MLSSEPASMAVWIWISRLVLVLAVVLSVLLKLIGAMITGFFRLLGLVALWGLVFDAFDDGSDCEA